MLFFQMVLFAGYAYVHLAATRLRPTVQAVLHVGLLLAAAVALPILPDASWKPTGEEQPTLRILLLLSASVGLPFFVLSTTGPLVQSWFGRTHQGCSPYRLYALSNAGSLLALISYPFVVERLLPMSSQSWLWSTGFLVFAATCTLAALGMRHLRRNESAEITMLTPASTATAAPTRSRMALWFALVMVPSVLLLAMTNQVCLDVASVPFLWVLPLTLYLLSFILCFDSERWYNRRLFAAGMVVLLAGVSLAMVKGSSMPIVLQIVIYFSAFFFAAMFCHGELARLKPHPQHLTSFYLVMSAGGAAGGLFVGMIAPLAFPFYWELHLGILAAYGLLMLVFWRDDSIASTPEHLPGVRLLLLGGLCWITWLLGYQVVDAYSEAITVSRNFYGVLRIRERDADNPEKHRMTMVHCRILHGMQFLEEERRHLPTTYYGFHSGIGRVMHTHHADRPRRVGLVGLGVGTLATYGQAGHSFRYYEIDPEVIHLAKRHFRFISDSQADVDITLGDARLSLERERDQQFDVLALDAFSSDAIPSHLLTREAFAIYLRHVEPDGIIAVHISNRHFNLKPVLAGLAREFDLHGCSIYSAGNASSGTDRAEWVLLTRERSVLNNDEFTHGRRSLGKQKLVWTDERSNLLDVLD
jgi:SAM-dependent methyltransferase